MVTNPYLNYYVNQAGGGIKVYAGQRYQRGHGFFGRIFSSTILPALKYLGRSALNTGADIVDDVMDGKSLRDAALKRGVEAGRRTAKDTVRRVKRYAQTGQGRPHKRNLHRRNIRNIRQKNRVRRDTTKYRGRSRILRSSSL